MLVGLNQVSTNCSSSWLGGYILPLLGSPPAAPEPAPDSREVHAGGKKFFFDILKNDRGTFIKLSEVSVSFYTHLIFIVVGLCFSSGHSQWSTHPP